MQTSTAMNTDIKALLTLLLLKTGTSSNEIQTVLMVTATSRVMIAEETSIPQRPLAADAVASNVATLRPSRSDMMSEAIAFDPAAVAMHSDIKALLTLVLLQNGVSAHDIQTTLRLAATSREAALEEQREAAAPINVVQRAAALPADVRPMTPRQALRAEHLAPITMREFAAA